MRWTGVVVRNNVNGKWKVKVGKKVKDDDVGGFVQRLHKAYRPTYHVLQCVLCVVAGDVTRCNANQSKERKYPERLKVSYPKVLYE